MADLIGQVDGGMKSSTVTVDNSGSKDSNKGQSDLMSDEEREAAEDEGDAKTKK